MIHAAAYLEDAIKTINVEIVIQLTLTIRFAFKFDFRFVSLQLFSAPWEAPDANKGICEINT